MAGFQPGTYKLRDVNHDGKITSDSDRVFLGNSGANFRWSLTNTFTYGNWSLMVYINSIWGGGDYFINGGNTPWNDGYANRGDMNHPFMITGPQTILMLNSQDQAILPRLL
jgi:hypothetical protein